MATTRIAVIGVAVTPARTRSAVRFIDFPFPFRLPDSSRNSLLQYIEETKGKSRVRESSLLKA